MTPEKQALTDEQFADLLLKEVNPHAACSPDGDPADADLEEISTALRVYRTDMLQWAERRSASQPSLVAEAARSAPWALPQWSMALVALVTLAGGVVRLAQNQPSESGPAATNVAVQMEEAAASDPAADDRLLSSIHTALSYHAASPVDGLRLQENTSHQIAISSEVTD
ncbi:MAG: hypothetical protein ACRYGF_10700 [Janthinobacterium lividum]